MKSLRLYVVVTILVASVLSTTAVRHAARTSVNPVAHEDSGPSPCLPHGPCPPIGGK